MVVAVEKLVAEEMVVAEVDWVAAGFHQCSAEMEQMELVERRTQIDQASGLQELAFDCRVLVA